MAIFSQHKHFFDAVSLDYLNWSSFPARNLYIKPLNISRSPPEVLLYYHVIFELIALS